MHDKLIGTRRAILKGSVALAGITAATGGLVACEPGGTTLTGDPIADTEYGQVKGAVEDGINTFKGVRYGADTSNYRFAAPQKAQPWEGVADALAYGASAPQAVGGDGGGLFSDWRPATPLPNSEDCLFLNVWTPGVNDGAARPVMVWFHGGGFSTGSGSSFAYDGVNLAKRGDVVVVTVNHRLNMFGYMNLTGYGEGFADSAAAGILDMVMALEWVRDNISSFGGDPNNVLIFGESGGGSKVCTLLSMPAAKGLYHRAVVQSGPRIQHPPATAAAVAAGEVVAKLGLSADTIDQIRTMPVADIQAAAQGVALAGAGPTLDGKNLLVHPFEPTAAPAGAGVPLLIGSNRTEGTSLAGGRDPTLFDITWETLPDRLATALPGRDIPAIIDAYRTNFPQYDAPEVYFTAQSDATFFAGSITVADRKAAQGDPVYFYHLDWTTPVHGGKRYVPHALDIGMAFDNVAKSESMSGPAGPEPQAIADQMSESWLAFAKTGNPNNPNVPEWPAYTAQNRSMMVFRTEPGVEIDIRATERSMLES